MNITDYSLEYFLKKRIVFEPRYLGDSQDYDFVYRLCDGVLSNEVAYTNFEYFVFSNSFIEASRLFLLEGLIMLGGAFQVWNFGDWLRFLFVRKHFRIYRYCDGLVSEIHLDDITTAWVFARSASDAKRLCLDAGLKVDIIVIGQGNSILRNKIKKNAG